MVSKICCCPSQLCPSSLFLQTVRKTKFCNELSQGYMSSIKQKTLSDNKSHHKSYFMLWKITPGVFENELD
jgi:hypothetical protein